MWKSAAKIQRRKLILGGAALAISSAANAKTGKHFGSLAMADEYFLSEQNPIATADQRLLDKMAIELMSRPDIEQAKKRTLGAFALVTDKTVSDEVMAMLPDYVESFCFRSIQLAVNSDANYPRIYRIYSPAANFLGNDVPESRWGSENPDNLYRIIPIAHGGRYVLRGKRQANPPSDVSYVLVADTNTSITIGLLGQSDLEVAADGSFEITLDETPANGRKNHIQTTPQAQYLFIRDSLSDWLQTPNALRIERLNPPSAPPVTMDELAARAALVMQLGVAPAYYWNRLILNAPGQTMSQPKGTGPSGGLLTQQTSHGWLVLNEGQSAIMNFTQIEAAYTSIVLYDMWGRSLEYRDHLTSLNNTQMKPDADGSFSFVIAAEDPGVHNWLDTMGLNELNAGIRWQGISPSVTEPPRVSVAVIGSGELSRSMPDGIERVTQAQRAAQIARRQQEYDRRFTEA